MVKPGLDFFALVFALFKAGVAPVLIDPGMGLASIGGCLREAAPELFFGIPRALLARRVLRWGRPSVRRAIAVTPGRRWPGFETLDDLRRTGRRALEEGVVTAPVFRPTAPDQTAAILFTTGSTGPAQGRGVYSRDLPGASRAIPVAIRDRARRNRPLHLSSLSHSSPRAGDDVDCSRHGPDPPGPRQPRQAIPGHRGFRPDQPFRFAGLVASSWTGGPARGLKIPTLRRVVTAGAPASARVLGEFARLLEPPAEIYTPYGATEALPIASIGSTEILEETRFQTDRGARRLRGPAG